MTTSSIYRFKLDPFYSLVTSITLTIVMYLATTILVGRLNPDWVAYSSIFDNGAWLKDEGRDIGFLLIIDTFKLFFGKNYELFRLLIAIYFTYFTFFFAKGKLLNYTKSHTNYFVIALAIIAFCIIRFTIQIREGMAFTFLVYGINALSKLDSSVKLRKITISIIPFIMAKLIHAGTTIFLLVAIVSIIFFYSQNISQLASKFTYKFLSVVILTISILFPFLYYSFFDINSLLNTERYAYDESSGLTIGKIIFWIAYGLLYHYLIKQTNNYNRLNEAKNPFFKIFIDITSNILLRSLFIIVFLFVILQLPPAVTTSFIRLLNLVGGILFLYLSFKTRNNLFFLALALFLIIDNVRVVVEQIAYYDSL